MSDTTESTAGTGEISDTQVDKYFETGGNEESISTPEPKDDFAENDSQKEKEVIVNSDQKQEKYVPYGALHEERERRKEMARELAQQREHAQRLEGRFNDVMQRLSTPQEKPPSMDEDPLGAMTYKQQQLERVVAQQQAEAHQRRQAEQYQSLEQQFISRYQDSAMQFAKSQPDFAEAYQHLNNDRLNEFIEAGWSQKEAQRLLQEDEKAIVAKAYQDDVNPAERIYKLAQRRGYKAADKAANGSTKQTKEADFERLEKGLNASKSLGTAGGKTHNEVTLESLADMDDAEFDKNWSKMVRSHSQWK